MPKKRVKKTLKNSPEEEQTLRLFWGALKKFDSDQGFFLASAITFNFLICLIPLILLLLGLIGTYLYSDQEIFRQVQRYFEIAFPSLDPRITQTLIRQIFLCGSLTTPLCMLKSNAFRVHREGENLFCGSSAEI